MAIDQLDKSQTSIYIIQKKFLK